MCGAVCTALFTHRHLASAIHPRQCSDFLPFVDEDAEARVKSLPRTHTAGTGVSALRVGLRRSLCSDPQHREGFLSLAASAGRGRGGLQMRSSPSTNVSVTMSMFIIGTYHFYNQEKITIFFLTKKEKMLVFRPPRAPSPYTSQCYV